MSPNERSVEPDGKPAPITDSPWFWVAVFCTAAAVFLLAIGPQYAARQRRLEMQYLARQEILERQAAGQGGSRAVGQEGDAPPPAAGELIIPLWPLLVPIGMLFALSSVLLWRGRRRANAAGESRGEPS